MISTPALKVNVYAIFNLLFEISAIKLKILAGFSHNLIRIVMSHRSVGISIIKGIRLKIVQCM